MTKTLLSACSTALACAWLAMLGTSALAADADPMDLDADILADIAKQKARANTLRQGIKPSAGSGAKDSSGEKNKDCGAINIGNVVGNRRVGFAPVDVNVVIVGDILNVNNKCK